MKIGFVLDDSLDTTDGVQQHVLTLGRWLESSGHEVHYLVGQTKRTDISNLHSLGRNIKVRFNRNKLSIPLKADAVAIRQLLQREKFDVLHVQMPFSPILAGKIIKYAPAETVVVATFHILPYGRTEKAANKLLAKITKATQQRIQGVISVSEPAARYAREHLGLESTVIPNMIDLKSFKNPPIDPGKERTRIVYLGRLVKRKGPMEFLKAIAALDHELWNDIEIIIASAGPMQKKLEQFAQEAKISHIVHFVGFVAEDKKASLLGSADIAVFPSLSGESFGIVLLEAMASGAGVVLAGDNPGYRSVLGSLPETLFSPTNTQAFAGLLTKFITDEKARQETGRQQHKLVMQYDVNTVGRQVLDFYKNVSQS